MSRLCNEVGAMAFIMRYKGDCQTIANQLDVPVENILGLAASESLYGQGRIAMEWNNYFSMHAPAPFQIGAESPKKNRKIKVAKFSSFLQSAQSFAARFGHGIRGKKDPRAFAQALVDHRFNTNDEATGGRENFKIFLVDVIKAVKVRLSC
jgi:flagellum-specific peptidoglycan hydrolase FlgJ